MADEPDFAREILVYLLENPDGKDTLEGIARFWIMKRQVETLVDEIRGAVTLLVQQGYLREKVIYDTSSQGSERYYEVNGTRIKDIAEYVKQNTR